MGNIWATDKLALFIAFVLPGFISMQIYRLFVAGDDSDIVKKERTAERLGAKKRRGERIGRKLKLTPSQVQLARELLSTGEPRP